MDIKNIVDTAENVIQQAGGAQNVPGVAQVTGAVHGAVAQAKAKADAAGLGGVFEQLENVAEQKIGMDLDGDGDTGVAGANRVDK